MMNRTECRAPLGRFEQLDRLVTTRSGGSGQTAAVSHPANELKATSRVVPDDIAILP